jgi:hypothetical protein
MTRIECKLDLTIAGVLFLPIPLASQRQFWAASAYFVC